MARNKTPKFAWRSFFAAAPADMWTIIAKAMEIAAEDDLSELKKRRDGIVEQLYRLSWIEEKTTGSYTEAEGDRKADGDEPLAERKPLQKIDAATRESKVETDGLHIERGEASLETREHLKVQEALRKDLNEAEGDLARASTDGPKPHMDGSEKVVRTDEIELQAAIEQDSRRMQEILQLRSRLSVQNKNEEDLLQAVTSLEEMSITVEELKATEIGKAVSALRKHPARVVQSSSKALVKLWKELVEDFQTVTDTISKTAAANKPETEGGLEAPPLDAATLASRGTSAELSQLLEDFTAEDLAAGLEKLSSTVAPTPRTEDGKLAFFSPVFDTPLAPKQVPSKDQEPGPANDNLQSRDKAAAEKWYQSAKYDDIRPGSERAGQGGLHEKADVGKADAGRPAERGVEAGGASVVGATSEAEKERMKRLRNLEDDDSAGEEDRVEKKPRLGEAPEDKRTKESSLSVKTESASAADRGTRLLPENPPPAVNGLKTSLDRVRTKTPDLTPRSRGQASSPSRSTGDKQLGALQVASPPRALPGGKQPGSVSERVRNRTPDLPGKAERPSLSPVQAPGRNPLDPPDGQKHLPKPRTANNFLDFSDAAKRATAPPRRNPEVRDVPQTSGGAAQTSVGSGEGGAQKQLPAGSSSEARIVESVRPKRAKELGGLDDDPFEELELIPKLKKQTGQSRSAGPEAARKGEGRKDSGRGPLAAEVSRGKSSVESDSASELGTGLLEEDGFLSDSSDESDSFQELEAASKLEETKRRLHEKYLQLENAKKSRTTLVIKAGDVPVRRKTSGQADKGKVRDLHSKLSRLSRR